MEQEQPDQEVPTAILEQEDGPRATAAERASAGAYVIFFGIVFALSLAMAPDPSGVGTHTQLGLPPCGFYVQTGIPCLSCGMTTAFSAMAHGRILTGFRTHPFAALLFLACLAGWFGCVVTVTGRWSIFGWLERRAWAFWGPFIAVVALASWGYKIAATR